MSNYSAIIFKLGNVRKHTGADRLFCTDIYGYNIIVGLNVNKGDVGVYFPVESQIGLEFATANDLIRRTDAEGKTAGGMFDATRRVRCQTIRGEKSMGFWTPIESLAKTLSMSVEDVLRDYPVGKELDKIGDISISTKYIPRTNREEMSKSKQPPLIKKTESRVIGNQFNFHSDTSQLGKNLHRFTSESIIAITWKKHGTSGIASHCLVKKELTWYEKLLKKVNVDIADTEYDYLFSSRKVIKNAGFKKENTRDSRDLWTIVGEEFRDLLHKGETVYFEIVGYTKEGNFIQKDFDYGCKVGEHKVYIYRITQTNVDGVVYELPWSQVKERCVQIGAKHVPEIYHGTLGQYMLKYTTQLNNGVTNLTGSTPLIEITGDTCADFLTVLKKELVYDQDSQFCVNVVPEEGICIRIDKLDAECYKLKAFKFLNYESKQLDTGEVDMETTQNE